MPSHFSRFSSPSGNPDNLLIAPTFLKNEIFNFFFQIALWVFAEGTRSMEHQLQPFKKGAFNIAIEAQVRYLSKQKSVYI